MIYLWDTAKAPLRGKFRTIKSYIRKEEKSKIKVGSKGLRAREADAVTSDPRLKA